MVFSSYNGNQIETLSNNGIDHSYAYDPNGNMTTDGVSALKLEYNFLNLVSEAKDLSNNPKATYTWLANGVKTGVKDAAGTSGFEYLGSLVYKRTGTSTIELESAAFGGGRFIKSSNTITPNYFLTDHLGSTRAVVTINNTSRTLVEQSDYYPYGMRHENTNLMSSINRFRFSGKEDQTTGDIPMQDFGARFKGMTVPIWNRIDPLAEKYYSWSPYAYCANNPIIYIDSNGMEFFVSFDGEEARELFLRIMNGGLGGQFNTTLTAQKDGSYKVGFEKTKGGGNVDKLSSGETAFYKGMKEVIDSEKYTVSLGVYNGNSDINVGKYDNSTIDVADMNQYSQLNNPKEDIPATAQGKMIHEVREQYAKSVNEKWNPGSGASMANKLKNHDNAIRSEDSVNGNERIAERWGNRGSGIIVSYRMPDGSVKSIQIQGGQNSPLKPVIKVSPYKN